MTEPADVVAAAVRSVPGVAGLRGCSAGRHLHLPGRRVAGIRIQDSVTDVYVRRCSSVRLSARTAAQIRNVVASVIGGTVNVTVEDVVAPTAAESGASPDIGGGALSAGGTP
jgi:hypothetical protein